MHEFIYSQPYKVQHDVMGILKRELPFCFTSPPKPLANNIKQSLLNYYHEETRFTHQALLRALKRYLSSEDYLQTLTTGASRLNLWGEPAGLVTSIEAKQAQAIIASKQKLFDITAKSCYCPLVNLVKPAISLTAS